MQCIQLSHFRVQNGVLFFIEMAFTGHSFLQSLQLLQVLSAINDLARTSLPINKYAIERGLINKSMGSEISPLYVFFPTRTFSANCLVICSHLLKIELTTFCLRPGWIEIQFEGKSIGWKPVTLHPFIRRIKAGSN